MVFRLSENAFSTQKIEFFTHALKQNSPPGSYYHLPDPSTLTNLVPTPVPTPAEMGEESYVDCLQILVVIKQVLPHHLTGLF